MEKKEFSSFSSKIRFEWSISPAFYELLLRVQIPKAEKYTNDIAVFFALLGSARKKLHVNMLVKSTLGCK